MLTTYKTPSELETCSLVQNTFKHTFAQIKNIKIDSWYRNLGETVKFIVELFFVN